MRAVILAGGKGTRLKPYTTLIPKPLVPIGNEKSILEIIITQLESYGFNYITITVSHQANLIMAFFEDGKKWGVKIDYSIEDHPLSTIGPLTLIKDLPEDILILNGDILCNINFNDFTKYHKDNQADITVASFNRQSMIDFGVLEIHENHQIVGFKEKPVYNFLVSMGIYCIKRKIIESITPNTFYGFDHLMYDHIDKKSRMLSYPFQGFWFDIGRPEDYDYVNEHYDQIQSELGLKQQ